jgi:hypothetical protein
MFKKLLGLLSIGFLALSLTGCQTASITDIIHPKTDKLELNEDVFDESDSKPYIVGGILFIPYTRQNDFDSYDMDYYKYSLKLAAYKPIENGNTAVINQVKVIGKKDVTFKDINKDLALPLEFSKIQDNPSIQESENVLIDEIYPDNMNLTDQSVITVVLNVSVVENGETITKDLTYDFVPRTRTYNVQR